MYTGSLSENRICIGVPAPIRQALFDKARHLGMTVPEYMRHVFLDWFEENKEKE